MLKQIFEELYFGIQSSVESMSDDGKFSGCLALAANPGSENRACLHLVKNPLAEFVLASIDYRLYKFLPQECQAEGQRRCDIDLEIYRPCIEYSLWMWSLYGAPVFGHTSIRALGMHRHLLRPTPVEHHHSLPLSIAAVLDPSDHKL